ncbi:MAG: helix-turn-helix domain-containing protein [Nonlabens sp.]
MEKHDLNASSFAEKIGVGRSSMSHILSGRNKPSLDFVLAVLKTFGEVDLYWLLNGRGTYPKKSAGINTDTTEEVQSAPLPSSQNVQESRSESKVENAEESGTKAQPLPITNKTNKGKNITKVIICFDDGTFENFIP